MDANLPNELIYLSIGTLVNGDYNAVSTMMISGSSKRTGLTDLLLEGGRDYITDNNNFSRSVRKTGLDKELSVSAGTYYVQVNTVAQGNSLYNTAYSLDIEIELESGVRKQGVLAAI